MQVDPREDGGIFDAFEPPDPDLLRDCVHCGFCLTTCPTYDLWGEEMDSPRGRLYLMKMGLEGDLEMDETFVGHLDACLGCMACVTACPSGVQYGRLLEATRGQIERNHDRPLADRLFRDFLLWLFPHPSRLRPAAALAWLYQRSGLRRLVARSGLRGRLPPRLAALDALLPDARMPGTTRRLPERVAPRPARPGVGITTRRRVGLVTGCVQSVFFPGVNAATARVLASEGCEVAIPREQECCGALHVHGGHLEEGLERARRMIAVMEDAEVDTVVVNAAGCGSTLKEYGHLLRDDPDWAERAEAFSEKVRDVTELLDELEPVAPRNPIAGRVAYHDACHLLHGQGVRSAPRRVLSTIPDLEILDLPDAEICCGSAGTYNLVEPEPAEELGRSKVAAIRSTDPQAVATGNPGCILQLRRHLAETGDGGEDLPVLHPIQLVDCSIHGTDPLAPDRAPIP